MAQIEKLCSTPEYTKYFKDIQWLGKFELFTRFDDIESIVNNKINEKYRHFLAQPEVEGDTITWFSKSYSETPQRLSELQGEDRLKYEQIKNETLNHYKSVINSLRESRNSSEAKCLENATKFVNDDFVYCFDDKTVLGIWGMQLRKNIRKPLGIAMKNIFVKKKKPQPQPQPQPEPKFPVIDELQPEPDPVLPPQEPLVEPFIVRFNAGEGGILNGILEYTKHKDDTVKESEVPQIKPKEGYEFTGWDKDPNNYTVAGDTEFTAQYREIQPVVVPLISWWRGCLNWLLLLLLLALIFMVVWCCLLKKCHFNFCGCGCPEATTIVVPPAPKPAPTPPDTLPPPTPPSPLPPCNADATSGGYITDVRHFSMGQKGGKFVFEYNTENVPDEITIYDGPDTTGKVIFHYPMGGTRSLKTATVEFDNSVITVKVVGGEPGTVWNYRVNCPNG